MKKTRTLPSLRIDEGTFNRVEKAIEEHNKNSLGKLSVQDFRRIALELLSQTILQDRKDLFDLIDVTTD